VVGIEFVWGGAPRLDTYEHPQHQGVERDPDQAGGDQNANDEARRARRAADADQQQHPHCQASTEDRGDRAAGVNAAEAVAPDHEPHQGR